MSSDLFTIARPGQLRVSREAVDSLEWRPGERLVVTRDDDGTLRVESIRIVAERVRGLFAHLAPGRSLADELIAERRAEFLREEAESQAGAPE
jgi:hypothetical protein